MACPRSADTLFGGPDRLRKKSDRAMEPSEQYWSAYYNANLWQIRHNLQNTGMRYKLPILLTPLVLGLGCS